MLKEGDKTIEGLEWKFTIGDPPYLDLSATGVVNANKVGTYTLEIATTYLGETYSKWVRVVVVDEIEFTLDKNALTLALTDDVQGYINGYEFDYSFKRNGTAETVTVTWSTDNDKVATVSDDGVVTAVGLGKAKITATSGEYTCYADITVTRAVVNLSENVTKTVDVNENDTWAVSLDKEYGTLVDVTDGTAQVVSEVKDEKVYLLGAYVSGKEIGDVEILYFNTQVKSFKITVKYVNTYSPVDASAFIPNGAGTAKFTLLNEKTYGRYGVYQYKNTQTEAKDNLWYNRTGMAGLGEAFAKNDYLAFDIFIADTTNVYAFWFFFVDSAEGFNSQFFIQPDVVRTVSAPLYPTIDGTSGILLQDQTGINVPLTQGEWTTVIIDLDKIYEGKNVAPNQIFFALRELDWSKGSTAYFTRFRLYTEAQYETFQNSLVPDNSVSYALAHKTFVYGGKTSATTATYKKTAQFADRPTAYRYETGPSTSNNIWVNRIGVASLSEYYANGNYFAFDIYLDNVAKLSSFWFCLDTAHQQSISLNYEGGAAAHFPLINQGKGITIIDSATGAEQLLEAGKWLTIIVDIETLYSAYDGASPDTFLLSVYETGDTQGSSLYYDNFRLYNETQYTAYKATFSATKA
jgi:hypothetical protein